MITQIFEFTDEDDYTLVNTEIDSGVGKLALIDRTPLTFSQIFTNDTDFTYDNTKAEFTAGILRQKDLRPIDAVLAATYTSSKNLNWSTSGSLIGTETGSTTLSGGKLACIGGGNNSIRYESSDIGASGNVGAIKIKYTPNYSGSPPSNYNIFEFSPTSGNNDRMLLFHATTGGTLRLTAYTSVGTIKYSAVAFGATWNPVAGTEYEIELNWDTVAGAVRLFVNGVLQGAMAVSSYARGSDADRLTIGAGLYPNTDAYFNDIVLFSTVQHTSGYTPGYTLPETAFIESKIDLPLFSYTLVGAIQSLDELSADTVGNVGFIINSKYWNGIAWVASDGTFAQSNSEAQVLANISSLVISSDTVSVSVVFESSNVLGSVDNLLIEYTGQQYPLEGTIKPVQQLQIKKLISYEKSSTAPLNTVIKVVLEIDGVKKWINDGVLDDSDGTILQANTAAEITEAIEVLDFGVTTSFNLIWVLSTADVESTPMIDSSMIEFNYGAQSPSLPDKCRVYGYVTDVENNPIEGAEVTVKVSRRSTEYSEASGYIILGKTTQLTDADGGFFFNLIRSSEYEAEDGIKYILSIKKSKTTVNTNGINEDGYYNEIEFTVPDEEEINITDQIGGA